MFDLTNKVAIVTGGNGGLGLAFARGLVKAGASIAIWGRNEDKNFTAAAELQSMGGDAAAFKCDVVDEAQIKQTFAKTLDRFGKVDICIANAGSSGFKGMSHKAGAQLWQKAIDLNLNAVVNTFSVVTEHLLERNEGGKLIAISSAAAHKGFGGAASYSTTKAAVVGLTRALAVELGWANIQVNAILPGYVETEMSLDSPKEFQEAAKRRSVSGKVGTLEDMEGIAVFLSAKESSYITGQDIIVDGGYSIYPI